MKFQEARDTGQPSGTRPNGDRRALARLLTWIDERDARGLNALADLDNPDPPAYVVGITGPPGAGKSTLVRMMIEMIRGRQERVAVLAIDPTSPFTGGALLGDRIRMSGFDEDKDVFIRSMAARKQLGGISLATPAAIRALSAFRFDWVLVETVGVGQSEIDISDQADSTVVVVSSGWGDHVQASKAGVLEIADLIAVNKADFPGSEETVRSLKGMLRLGDDRPWMPRVEPCSALKGDGMATIWTCILDHRDYLVKSGKLEEKRRHRRIEEFRCVLRELELQSIDADLGRSENAQLAEAVASGERDPMVAAQLLHHARRSLYLGESAGQL